MDDGLKQRVVGAVVLVGIAVIVLPSILNGPDKGPELAPVEIPAKPKMPALKPINKFDDERNEAIRGRIHADRLALVTEPTKQQQPNKTAPEDKKSDTSGPGAQDSPAQALVDIAENDVNAVDGGKVSKNTQLPSSERHLLPAWTIQLGSFKESKNAQDLVDLLRQQGYQAYSEAVSAPQIDEPGTVTRVFVGPELQRDRAELIRAQLEQQLSLKGMLVRFVP